MFSETSLSVLFKKFKIRSIGILSRILGNLFGGNLSPRSSHQYIFWRNYFKFCLWGLQWDKDKTCSQMFDIMFTSHDIVTSIPLWTNCDLTFCIFESRYDSNSVTINFWRVLKDKLARNVGREWSGSYSNKNHQQFADNLPRTHKDFPKMFQIFSGNDFGLDSHKIGLKVIFH